MVVSGVGLRKISRKFPGIWPLFTKAGHRDQWKRATETRYAPVYFFEALVDIGLIAVMEQPAQIPFDPGSNYHKLLSSRYDDDKPRNLEFSLNYRLGSFISHRQQHPLTTTPSASLRGTLSLKPRSRLALVAF
ncbi:hypothetical protein PM082_006291 [Marasmius tenuissimus]|nr:hypothetical protein PM082_006291 [Marasmius tenuissimus]